MRAASFVLAVVLVLVLSGCVPRAAQPLPPVPLVVICDHPRWTDAGFAAVAASCYAEGSPRQGVRVVVLD